ncbi:MAG TPA: NifU family protein [Acidimicrobiales bacterium]
MSIDAGTDTEIVHVTDRALAKILDIRSGEDNPESLGLRIEVTGVQGVEYAYDLSFEPLDERDPDDTTYDAGGLTMIIPANSVDALRGATLDLPSNPNQGGLVIRNPNRPNALGGTGDLELTGTIAEKVATLLERRINPALAAHGGYASLVGVEDTTVYVTMGGGCQGCAMSQATLSQGIKVAILDAIPEVTDVIDTTNHAAGDNPFYS